MSPRSFAKKYISFFLKKKCNQRPLEETGSILSPTRLIYSIWFRQLTAVFRRWPFLFFFSYHYVSQIWNPEALQVWEKPTLEKIQMLIPNLLRLDE